MKNILIPTTLESDSLNAVKTAIKHADGKNCSIILMLVYKTPDTDSGSLFLRELSVKLTTAQLKILEDCNTLADDTENCRLKVHHQYSISRPLLKNLIDHLGIDLIILTASYKKEYANIHTSCTKLLLNCKCPILHLGVNQNDYDFNKALFLEHDQTKLGIQELQQIINKQFTFKIVSQAKFPEEQNPADITPLLIETISKNNIDLLIETRKVEKRKLKKKENALINETLGLPMLSIYDEVV